MCLQANEIHILQQSVRAAEEGGDNAARRFEELRQEQKEVAKRLEVQLAAATKAAQVRVLDATGREKHLEGEVRLLKDQVKARCVAAAAAKHRQARPQAATQPSKPFTHSPVLSLQVSRCEGEGARRQEAQEASQTVDKAQPES